MKLRLLVIASLALAFLPGGNELDAAGEPGVSEASAPAVSGPAASAPAPPAIAPDVQARIFGVRARIDEGEQLLTELRFAEAIVVLGDGLASLSNEASGADTRALRTRALDLRAQAYLSLGKADLADQDFDSLVRADPAYSLDERLLSPKIVARFKKIRAALTGTLKLSCRPADLRVRVDDADPRPCPAEPMPILAGEHTLSGERTGFDPADLVVSVAAGEEKAAPFALVPNARTLVMKTAPAGVEVVMDDRPVGITAPGTGEESAPLVIEPVPPGEHRFRLRKDCRVERLLTYSVVVDMLDLSPVVLKTVVLPPARSLLSVRSDPPGAEIFLAGEPLGASPVESRDVCAGSHMLEARFPTGTRWLQAVDLPAGGTIEIPVSPRPDLRVTLEDASGAALQPVRERLARFVQFNLAPAPDKEPAVPGAPPDAGLALDARLVAGRLGTRLRLTLSSQAHAQPEIREFDFDPVVPAAPDWRTFLDRLDTPLALRSPSIGALLVDVETSHAPVVLEVRSGSAAAAAGLHAGDEIVSVQGAAPAGAGDARRKILEQAANGPVVLKVRSGGAEREVRLSPAPAPTLPRLDGAAADAPSLHGIFIQARVLAASGAEPGRPLALLASGLVLLQFGESEKALRDSFLRVDLPEGPGVSRGTVLYLTGIAYEAAGSRAEATAAFTAAAALREATLHGLDDATIATAARARAERVPVKP